LKAFRAKGIVTSVVEGLPSPTRPSPEAFRPRVPMRYFEHNDIIVPRKHLDEWTKWAIVVDSVDGDGTIHAFPRGGGFGLIINPVKVEEYDFIKVPQEKLENPAWKAVDVYADWVNKTYRVWSTGENWNGWAIPFFEFDEAMKYSKASLKTKHVAPTIYDPKQDAFITTFEDQPDEPQVEQATEVYIRGRGPMKLYPLGGGWTWQFIDKEKRKGKGKG